MTLSLKDELMAMLPVKDLKRRAVIEWRMTALNYKKEVSNPLS